MDYGRSRLSVLLTAGSPNIPFSLRPLGLLLKLPLLIILTEVKRLLFIILLVYCCLCVLPSRRKLHHTVINTSNAGQRGLIGKKGRQYQGRAKVASKSCSGERHHIAKDRSFRYSAIHSLFFSRFDQFE